MLQLTPQSRVFLAREPADFRRGIDGLAALCRCYVAIPVAWIRAFPLSVP
jgi:hypothetical protein